MEGVTEGGGRDSYIGGYVLGRRCLLPIKGEGGKVEVRWRVEGCVRDRGRCVRIKN